MSYGFEQGRSYNRRQDIHARFGGNQQSGIIVVPAHNLIFIMSGARGAEYGYDDEVLDDGTVLYFGEGQVGDQKMERGNKAIANHAADGRSILMFHKQYPERVVIFQGEMLCDGWEWREGRDADGNQRKVIVFRLRHIEGVAESAETIQVPASDTLDELQRRAYAAAGIREPIAGSRPRTIYERSADVPNYVLARAKGCCEGCRNAAPFLRADGSAYLEPHHIRRVSDGGPDHPGFVIALCPNCHRRVHAGGDGRDYNSQLLAAMATIEAKIRV